MVKQLIKPDHLSTSIGPLIKLLQCFLDVNCSEGVQFIANLMSFYMSQMSDKEARLLNRTDIENYLNCMLSLEEDPDTCDQNRLTTFAASLFRKLESSLQSQLVLFIRKNEQSRWGKLLSFKLLFDSLCGWLMDCKLGNDAESLSSHLKAMFELDLTAYLNERMDAFELKLAKLNAIQLCQIVCDVFDSNRERVKDPNFNRLIQNGSQLILSRLKDEVSLPVLEMIGKSSTLFSVLDTGGTLVETIMKSLIISSQDTKNLVGKSYTQLIEKIHLCADIFFSVEKNPSHPDRESCAARFYSLFIQLPLSVKMESMLRIQEKESNNPLHLKNIPRCFEWFKDVFKFCLKQDFVTGFVARNTSFARKIVLCLLWLEDDEAWQDFSTSICRSHQFKVLVYPFGDNLPRHHMDVMHQIANTPAAMEAFNKISIHAESQTKMMGVPELPPFSWQQPSATLPGHTEVETFLRSNIEFYVCEKFTGIGQARKFAKMVEQKQPTNNFSVTTETSGVGKMARCVIRKNRNYHEIRNQPSISQPVFTPLIALKSKLEACCKKRTNQHLADHSSASSKTDSPFGSIVDSAGIPLAKRTKI